MHSRTSYSPLGLASLLIAALPAQAVPGFEAPPAPAQTTPRPFDGEIVSANPPCFVYPAAKRFSAYVVQYSRSSDFPPEATHTLTGKWMLNAPEQPLAPGRWFWRWRPGTPGDGGRNWSPVRRFTVPDTAPVVPFPDVDGLVRRIGTSHPRVFVTADALGRVRREMAESHGPTWRKRIHLYAEQAARKQLLPEPAFLPPRGRPERTEQYQKTFVKYRPFFAEMTRLAQNYLLSGDALSGQEARRRLMSIVQWDPNGSTSLHHNDEVGTDVVRHCPRAYDWIYPLLTPDERKQCLQVFRIRMEEMFQTLLRRPFEVRPYSSHVMGYYLPDLLQACLAVSGDLSVNEMLHYTMLQLWSPFYPPFGDADGGWNEGPSYWGWIARVCARTYRLVERATGIPVHERSNLRNQVYYKLYGNPPWFKMSPFGDGQEGPARHGDAMLMLASLYHNPYAKWYGEQMHARLDGLDAVLFPLNETEARPPLDLPQGRCFFDVGLACSHTNLADGSADVAFLLRSCPFGSVSHAYADQNTFILDAYGEPLIIASGYYQLYGCPHHREWTWQTIASNSILVNGKGQKIRSWDAKGRIAEFATTVAADYTVGDAHAAYPNVLDRYDRRALFLRPLHTGGPPLIVIHDRIRAKVPSTFQFLLHALERMDVDPDARTVRIRRGRAACRVDFLAPAPLTFEQTDRFTVPPLRPAPNQWHLRAGTKKKAAAATSMIVLQPVHRRDEAGLARPRLEENPAAYGIVLESGERRIGLVFRKDRAGAGGGGAAAAEKPSAEFALCGVRTDAEAASVTWIGGRPHSAVFVGGTFVAIGGGPVLLRTVAPVALSAVRDGKNTLIETDATGPVKVEVRGLFSEAPGAAVDEEGTPVPSTVAAGGREVSLTLPPRRVVRLSPARPSSRSSAPSPGAANALLSICCAPVVRFESRTCPRVGRVRSQAPFPGTPGIWQLRFRLRAEAATPFRADLSAGAVSVVAEFANTEERTIQLPPASLDYATPVAVSADILDSSALRMMDVVAERAYGVNLVPNGSFEQVSGAVPTGWRAVTITRGAQCRIEAAADGVDGGRCIKVVCTEPTGGDFGVMLDWPGVRPTSYPRRFRLACRVRTDPEDAKARAGVQATGANWVFCQTTPRIATAGEWRESAREFLLPPGEDISHLRLHMTAGKSGAALFADRVELIELPPSEADATPAQVPLCMIGDSITWWGEADWWRRYLVERIPRLAFVGTHSARFGYSHAGEGGNSTVNVLARIDDIPACPYYHLLIGTNDNNVRNAGDVAPRARRTANNIRKIVQRLLRKPYCKKVFLGSILPCHTNNPLRDKTNAATNVLLREMFADGRLPAERVRWVEYEKPIRRMPDWQPVIRLHPTAAGYKVLADILAETLIRDLGIDDPAAPVRFGSGAGVRVDNLWSGGADGATRIPLIAGWYTLSFQVRETTGPKPAVVLHSLGNVKQPLRKEFAVPADARSEQDGRVYFDFYTEAEGYGYSRSRLALDVHGMTIDKIMIEKKRPRGIRSTYGVGAFVDVATKPAPGECVTFP